ncbi:MAG: hypothetical protein V4634_12975 [Pseudomonadota bacterium]
MAQISPLMRRQRRAPLWVCRAVAAILCGIILSAAAGAQGLAPNGVRGPAAGMATRSVSKYLGLERALQQAIAEHDRNTVSSMLDSDFELRSPASQDTSSQEDWLKGEFKKTGPAGRIRDLAVFETDDLSMVSFLLEMQGGKRKPHTYFIVDVWRQSTGKLQVRYVDTPANPPPIRDRPTGRE